jgi:F-type H+-transporting ATPase subunit epsilon
VANSYQLDIVTPERILFSEMAVQTIAPGSEGYLGILAGHADLMTTLEPGEVTVTVADGRTTSHIVIGGGFLEVSPTKTTILADSAERIDEIDVTRAEIDLEEARKMLETAALGSKEALAARRANSLAETRIRLGRAR